MKNHKLCKNFEIHVEIGNQQIIQIQQINIMHKIENMKYNLCKKQVYNVCILELFQILEQIKSPVNKYNENIAQTKFI